MEKKYIFVDYEGTLSESPKGTGENQSVLLSDLLFLDVFSQLKPVEKVKKYLQKQDPDNIFVLGVVDTNNEIKQKELWLKKHYDFIKEKNYIFISSEHKKVDIINEYVENKKINKKDVVFIDDKQKHLEPAIKEGYLCLNVSDINENGCIKSNNKLNEICK